MATFPHHLCSILQAGVSEQAAPIVLRSEVERGIARHRRIAADALTRLNCSLLFESAQASAEFDAWFYADAMAGAAWFDFTNPRTGTVVQARVVGGDIGSITPMAERFRVAERTLVLEYIRPGFVQLAPGLHTVDAARILSVQRNSTATYVDDAGVLQTAPANVVRWQGGQVLVESEATNLCLQSQSLNMAPWGGAVGAVAAAESWRGAVPFWTLAKVLATTSEHRTQTIGSMVAGESLTVTVALLAGTSDAVSVGLYSVVAPIWGLKANTDVQLVEGPGSFTQAGALVLVSGLSPTMPTLLRIRRTYVADTTGAAVFFYPGGSSSTTIGHSVKVTRVQVERALSPTSYIPSTTAAATRAADLITVAA